MTDPETDRLVLERILASVPSGIVHVAPNGAILRANAQAQAFLGLSFDELTGLYTADFSGKTVFEDGRPCGVEDYPVSRCLATGELQGPVTIGVEQPAGDYHYAIFTATPVAMPEGTGAVVTFVDITERRAAEAERERLRIQLAASERLAALGTLAAGVSHEINNPLTYVLGNLDLLLGELRDGPDDARDLAERAMSGARRVTRIVRQLRRFQGAVRESAQQDFSARGAVTAALELCRPHLRDVSGVQVLSEAANEDLLARGSEAGTVQILINLLVNAAQSAACPRIDIEVRAERDRAVIEIRDDGDGMDAEALERAFDPFFTTKGALDGTGLGLAVSRNEAERMGATLHLDSSPGVGTTARLALRRAACSQAEPASAVPAALDPGVRVLVIDDEPQIVEFFRRCFREHPFVACTDGEAALTRLERERFDVIFCDLVMPGTTGMQVHARLGARDPEQAGRVVFMTGGGYTEAAARFLDEFEGTILVKPFTRERVRRAARGVVARDLT